MEKKLTNNIIGRNNFYLSVIVFIAFLLRLINLGNKAIWIDEAYSISFASSEIKNIWGHRYLIRPVYFILLKVWAMFFGYKEFPLRMLSVIFGVFSIILIYKLAKLLFNRQVGLFSAFIMAISNYNINYSQQVRNYSLFVLLALFSMLMFVKLLRKNKRSYNYYLGVINILLVFTHSFGIFICIVQCSYLFFLNKKTNFSLQKNMVVFFSSQLAVIIIFVAVIVLYNRNFQANMMDFNYMPVNEKNFLINLLEVFIYGGSRQTQGGFGYALGLKKLFIPILLSGAYILLFLLGGFFFNRQSNSKSAGLNNRNSVLLLLAWIGITISSSYVFLMIFFKICLMRYFIATSPAFYILVSRGIVLIPKVKIKMIFVGIILLLSFYSLNILYFPEKSGDWKEAVKVFRENISAGDKVLMMPIDLIVLFCYYYRYDISVPLEEIDRYGKKTEQGYQKMFTLGENEFYGIALNASVPDVLETLNRLRDSGANILFFRIPWGEKQVIFLIDKFMDRFYYLDKRFKFEAEGMELRCYVNRKFFFISETNTSILLKK
ncbi:MAG: glycosyltransferase family 39 protein [Candidatus Omnitrophica bacterium]|nr:glycosyltransferase family 39 protein [Candidatus Omnitrophota bacterium]MBU4478023.1 glycosyltransferase family 39 protein [Candidatus Omnitrophota bacterium]MCG2703631.1 glycosyltransferase family 39 protein [Candidatus Omnitrophota bacterium]